MIRWGHTVVAALLAVAMLAVATSGSALAQGPMPEEAATLFPAGALASYSSVFTNGRLTEGAGAEAPGATLHPTFQHEIPLILSWSFRRDLQFTAVLPIVTRRVDLPGGNLGGTGLGDALVSLKYRFLRLDSERGTTQLAVHWSQTPNRKHWHQ